MPTVPELQGSLALAFDAFPRAPRRKLLQLRNLIYTTAAKNSDIGPVSETLKWGQPSYLPVKPRLGTPVRLSWSEKTPDTIHLLVHCQTTLVDTYRTLVGDELTFEGNRAVVVPIKTALPKAALALCIQAAFTYHQNKRQKAQ